MVGVKGQNVRGCQSWALLMMERIAVFKNPGCFCSVLPRDNLIIMAASKWGGGYHFSCDNCCERVT